MVIRNNKMYVYLGISWLLFVMFNTIFVNFPFRILGHVCYLIVSTPDPCCSLLSFLLLICMFRGWDPSCSSDINP